MKRKSPFFDDTVIKSHKKAPTCLAESSAPPLLSCKGLLDPQLKPSSFHLLKLGKPGPPNKVFWTEKPACFSGLIPL